MDRGTGSEPSHREPGLVLEREGSKPLPGPSVPLRPNGCGPCHPPAPSHQDGLARGWTCGGSSCWSMLRGPAGSRKPPLAPQAPLVSFFSSETGKCLSRAKASPQAQLSCSKVGGVESCSLSCLAHTLFMPGNPRLSPGWDGGRGSLPWDPASAPCCSPGEEPNLGMRTPSPGH